MKAIAKDTNSEETEGGKIERLISAQPERWRDRYSKCCRVLMFRDYVSVHKSGVAPYAFAAVVLCLKCKTKRSKIIRFNGVEPYKFFGSRKHGPPPENFKRHHWNKMQGFLSEYAMLNVKESADGEISYFDYAG